MSPVPLVLWAQGPSCDARPRAPQTPQALARITRAHAHFAGNVRPSYACLSVGVRGLARFLKARMFTSPALSPPMQLIWQSSFTPLGERVPEAITPFLLLGISTVHILQLHKTQQKSLPAPGHLALKPEPNLPIFGFSFVALFYPILTPNAASKIDPDLVR